MRHRNILDCSFRKWVTTVWTLRCVLLPAPPLPIQRKSPNQLCGLTHNEANSSTLTFIPSPWMALITWPRNIFLILCDPWYLHLWFLIFTPQNSSLIFACQGKKWKRMRFPFNFCIWRRKMGVFCICLSQGGRGTGEYLGFRWCQIAYFRYEHWRYKIRTRYEWCVQPQKLQVKNNVTLFRDTML